MAGCNPARRWRWTQAARNAGVAFASGRADLYAGTTLANTGSVLAGGDLNARTPAC